MIRINTLMFISVAALSAGYAQKKFPEVFIYMTMEKSGNRAAKEYAERDSRVNEGIAMKAPDRVPIQLFVGYFAAGYCGIPCSSVYYDPEKWRAANIRTTTELEPDVFWAQIAAVFGKAMEILRPLQMRWPDFDVSPNHCSFPHFV